MSDIDPKKFDPRMHAPDYTVAEILIMCGEFQSMVNTLNEESCPDSEYLIEPDQCLFHDKSFPLENICSELHKIGLYLEVDAEHIQYLNHLGHTKMKEFLNDSMKGVFAITLKAQCSEEDDE